MKKVLIVDDEPDILDAAAFRLRSAGYAVVTASDGSAGWAMVSREKPDVVLLDLALPGLSGYEVCQNIKNDETLRHIPVVIFTASIGNVTMEERMKSLRADDYLVKPFDPQELLAKIKKFAAP